MVLLVLLPLDIIIIPQKAQKVNRQIAQSFIILKILFVHFDEAPGRLSGQLTA